MIRGGKHGGGAYADDRASQWGFTSPAFYDCVFRDNSAGLRGGGMENFNKATPYFENVTFTGNTATVANSAAISN